MNNCIDHLRQFSKDGYPKLNNSQYENLVSTFKKEELIDAIACIIMESRNKKLPFPEKNIEQVKKKFNLLVKKNEDFINDAHEPWMKHEYDFDLKHHFGTIQLGHAYNDISNYFHREERYKVGGYNRLSPIEIWNGIGLSNQDWRKALKGFLSPLFRSVNNFKKIEDGEYMFCFRLSSSVYTAAQFKPNVAKLIYEKFSKNGNVIDFSCGWGDRLAGFYAASNTNKYLGTDPNVSLLKNYQDQISFYESLNGGKSAEIHSTPAEKYHWQAHEKIYDLIFTSPPYFSTETYAKGSKFESSQSWYNYKSIDSWINDFLFKTLNSCNDILIKDGLVIINIFDVEMKKNQRLKVCSPLVDFMKNTLKYEYLGYIGMRMKQRPKKFKDNDEKSKFMASYYVEPMWIFKKIK